MSDDENKQEDASTSLKMKKFFASKAMGTKAGRKVVVGFLGEEGDLVLTSLKKAAAKFSNKDTATTLKKDMLKLVLKAKLCFDEKLIAKETIKAAREPLTRFLDVAFVALSQPVDTQIDIQPLLQHINLSRDVLVDMMRPHIQQKNLEKLQNLFNFYSNADFVRALLMDPTYLDERNVIKENITAIHDEVQSRGDSSFANPLKNCAVNACPKMQLAAHGTFVGSQFCARHHLQYVQNDLEQPKFHQYLELSSRGSQSFVDYLKQLSLQETKEAQGGDFALYLFQDAVTQYRRVSRNLRKSRADVIYRKFIRNGTKKTDHPVDLSEQVNHKIIEAVQNYEEARFLHALEEAQQEVVSRLQIVFQQFIASPIYQEYVVGNRLPDELLAEAQRNPRASITAMPEEKS